MKSNLLNRKALLFGALTIATISSAQNRPNVIFIMADDLGFGDLECYNGKEKTPNLNQIAQEGCQFVNAYAVASTSTPSRYSFLTGRYSWREPNTGVAPGDAGMIISPETFTIADLFSQAGYSTAAFGKWHLGLGSRTGAQTWNTELDLGLTELGFDDWHIMAATADRVPCVYIQGNSEKGNRKINHGRVVNLDPNDPIKVSYSQSLGDSTWYDYPEAVKLAPTSPNDHHGATIVDSIPRIGHMIGGYAARWKDENIADTIVANTINYIRSKTESKEPFFVYMATNDIHVPRWPHKRFRGKSKMGLRGEAIMAFDWSVGQIMNTLKELNIDDNTLVIISSDNGPVLNDGYADQADPLSKAVGHLISGGLRGGKYSQYEGGTRVPFLVRWPAHVPQGQISHAMVSQIDFLGTMAQMLGVKIPVGQGIDSRKELNAWLGEDLENGRDYVLEATNGGQVSVRTKDWKYISNGELYRMSETELHDEYTPIHTPIEKTNVASANPDQVEVMKRIIAEESSKTAQLQVFENAKKILDATHPSEVTISELVRIDSLTQTDGLPGTQNGSQFHFTSEKITTEPTERIRLTFTSTNTHPQGQQNGFKAHCPVALSEIQILDEDGKALTLNEQAFSTNNQEKTEGSLSGLCDDDEATFWHSTWTQATESVPYLEIKLPKKISAFQFSYISKQVANSPQSILVSSVQLRTEEVPGIELPQSYIDTLQHEYNLASEHFNDPEYKSHLNEVVNYIQQYLTYKDRLQNNKFLVDNELAESNLAYLSEEELEFIRQTISEADDFKADCKKIDEINTLYLPKADKYYTLYNKKTKMYAGMQTATNSARKGSLGENDQNFYWNFVMDENTGAYLLYNAGQNMPVSRPDSKETIYTQDAAHADTWTLNLYDDGFFNIRIASSKVASNRDCLNDNGLTVNAYNDEKDMSTLWEIVAVKDKTTGITENVLDKEAQKVSSEVYNLNGQRVRVTERGIYIINGKKVAFH